MSKLNNGEVPVNLPSELELYLLDCREKRDTQGNQKVSESNIPLWSLEVNLVVDRKLLIVRNFKVTVPSPKGFAGLIGEQVQLCALVVGAFNNNLYYRAENVKTVENLESHLFGDKDEQ